MPPAFDCAEWLLPLPGDFPLLALAKHINARQNSSVLYEDIASAIDGGGEAVSESDRYKALIGCASHGGQLGVYANRDNPAYKTPEYISSGAKPEGIVVKVVRNPSAPKPAPQPIKTTISCDFEDKTLQGWAVVDGSFDASSGELVIAHTDSGKAVYDAQFDNSIIEADVAILDQGGNGGLIFRSTNIKNGADSYKGYYAGIASDGWLILGRADNNWTPLQSQRLDFAVGRKYHLKVQATGDLIKIYVDDMNTPKIVQRDGTFNKGYVGARTWHTGMRMDNFKIQKVDIFEDFNDHSTAAWKTIDGRIDAGSGELIMAVADSAKAINTAAEFVNFALEADIAMMTSGGNGGFIFRASNLNAGPDNYRGYYAGITSDGWVILGRADNSWNPLQSQKHDITIGRMYHVKVQAVGDLIQVFVDDMNTPKITHRDGTFGRGFTGVRVWHTGLRTDNFRVTSI